MGAWFEAQVTMVTVKNAPPTDEDSPPSSSSSSETDPDFLYHITYDGVSGCCVCVCVCVNVR